MELEQVGSKTYYIKNRTNIGIYMTGENRVCVIDTGWQGDGRKIDEIVRAQGWAVDYIINTHTHIDHVGGNEYLMRKYSAPAYCTDYDRTFAHYPELESAYINGGYPCRELREIYARPKMDRFRTIENNDLKGISWTYLPGHTFGMIGICTDDGVWFLGDSYLERNMLENYRFGYIYNIGEYLKTLKKIQTLEGKLFIPSHGPASEDICEIACMNIRNIEQIIDIIKKLCSDYISLENILKGIYENMGMRSTILQHTIISSTTKGYLSYLKDKGEMEYSFADNIMMWKCV